MPYEGPPAHGNAPPVPAFDPSVALDSFSALHIGGPPPSMNNMGAHDPIARSASSMSMRTYQSAGASVRSYPPQRHANTLPSAPNHALPSRQPYPQSDSSSMYTSDSPAADNASMYSYDDQGMGYGPAPHLYPAQQRYPPQHPNPGGGFSNPLYAAASNVLGMGPPPGAQIPPGPPMGSHPGGPSYASSYTSYRSSESSIATSYSAPHVPSNNYNQRPSSFPPVDDGSEIEPRPPLLHQDSVSINSHKTKAIDLSAPPYTKEYIDQYRQRIKADPDPEAHFLYAKYLIDAARKIRSTNKDQRSAKKYTEVLIGESLKVVRRLATQGDAYDEAQFYLANCYGTGSLGLQVDHERAYHLYLQAAKQNHAAACYRVAVCNEIGAGTRKEPTRAANFYRKAASLGDTAAMYKLGMILLQGALGEQKNPREAVGWLRRAAEQADEENPHALHELAVLHEQGQIVPHDPLLAKQLLTQSAHLGYTPSQYKLGQCYEYGSLTCPVDPRRSIAWYTKAAEKGDSEAELALSGWYLTGSEGVLKQSDSEAYLWARRAANKGLSNAEYAVGYYAEVGIGIKQDIEFAKRWYMRAAGMDFCRFLFQYLMVALAQGNKRAMNRLTEMKRMGNKRLNMARPTRQQAKDECIII